MQTLVLFMDLNLLLKLLELLPAALPALKKDVSALETDADLKAKLQDAAQTALDVVSDIKELLS